MFNSATSLGHNLDFDPRSAAELLYVKLRSKGITNEQMMGLDQHANGMLVYALMVCVVENHLPFHTAKLMLEDLDLADSYLSSVLGSKKSQQIINDQQGR